MNVLIKDSRKRIMMHHLKGLYRDSVIIFLIFILWMGISQMVQRATVDGQHLKEFAECFCLSAMIASPFTLIRIFTGSKPPNDKTLDILSAILACIVVTFISFSFMGNSGYELF